MLDKLRNLKWSADNKKAKPGAAKSATAGQPKAGAEKTPERPPPNAAALPQALEDPAEKIRNPAVATLEDPQQLLTFALDDPSEKVRETAARQYTKQLSDTPESSAQLDQFYADTKYHSLLKIITGYSPHPTLRSHGSGLFSNEDDLCDIAINTRYHDTRMAAADRINSLDVVNRCWRKVKTKDKIAARALKERLDTWHQAEKQQREQTETVERLLESMQNLSTNVWSPHYSNHHQQLMDRWQALGFSPSSDDRQQFERNAAIAGKKVAQHAQQQQLHEQRADAIDALGSHYDKLLSCELAQLPDTHSECKTAFDTTCNSWQQADDQATDQIQTDVVQQSAFDQRRKQLGKLLKTATAVLASSTTVAKDKPVSAAKHLKALTELQASIGDGDKAPVFARELPAMIAQLQEQQKQQRKINDDALQAIGKQFGALQGAIRSSRWGPAKSMHDRLRKKIARLDTDINPRTRQAQVDKLENLGKQLHDLGDWKEFASTPKLEALCEQMEKLPAAKLPPKDQADRIKELQQQWKALGSSPAQQDLWPRFKTAADTAYEPCKKYFAARREEKQQKLNQRDEICQMLQNYLDNSNWETPDWRAVERTISTAKREWRERRVYDRKASKPLDKKFDGLISQLEEKITPVYEASAEEKRELIEKVKQLGESEINQHCINQVKRIQSVWKTGGIIKRKTDQALWKEFSSACTVIFDASRQQQREQYQSSIEHVTRARAIIGQLRSMAKDSSIDDKKMEELQDEFRELPEFPERDNKFLHRDLTKAVDAIEQRRQGIHESSRKAEFDRLVHKAQLCEQLEALAGMPATDAETQMKGILDEWVDGDKTDNNEWKKAMNLRRDSITTHLRAGSSPDFEKNTHERRILCIEMEILQDAETPTEDKQLRMQHQLEKLKQGLNSGTGPAVEQQRQALYVRWLCAFPPHAHLRDKLNERFNTSYTKSGR